MMSDEYLNRMRGTLGMDWPMEAIEELLNEAVRARNEESRLRAENAALNEANKRLLEATGRAAIHMHCTASELSRKSKRFHKEPEALVAKAKVLNEIGDALYCELDLIERGWDRSERVEAGLAKCESPKKPRPRPRAAKPLTTVGETPTYGPPPAGCGPRVRVEQLNEGGETP